ncbi:MAG: cell division protein FtsL [Lysobacteraceae bacterium]
MVRLFGIVALLSLVVASGIAVVHARHAHRQQFVALTALERERDELNIEFGRLQLEQATLAEAHRVERIARTDLGMKFPEPAELRVVRP